MSRLIDCRNIEPPFLTPRRRSAGAVFWRLAAILVVLAVANLPTTGRALSCMKQPIEAIALCDGGACTDGFMITTGIRKYACDFVPAVDALSNRQRTELLEVLRGLGHEEPSGIYQLTVDERCLYDASSMAACRNAAGVVKLSDDPDPRMLKQHKDDWEAEARWSRLSVGFWSSGGAAIIVAAALLIWPWLLFCLAGFFRRHIGVLLLVSIPMEAFIAFELLRADRSDPFGAQPKAWFDGETICIALLAAAIPIQLGYVIFRRWRRKARRPKHA